MEGATALRRNAAGGQPETSHNLVGQRLGRKGRDTRQRVLDAATRLMQGPVGEPVVLSDIAREASVGLTTLYLYFADLGEVLLAALEPVWADAESFMSCLRVQWGDDELDERCLEFVGAHRAYWFRHARILHHRNLLAEAKDRRFLISCIDHARPIVNGLIRQMEGDTRNLNNDCFHSAVVLLMGIERVATIASNTSFRDAFMEIDVEITIDQTDDQVRAQSRILATTIRSQREAHRRQGLSVTRR